MFLEVANEFREQEPSAAQLSRERAVRVSGFERAGRTRGERAQLVELGEHTFGFCGQSGVATESSKTSFVG